MGLLMRNILYTIALFAVVVCVFIILVAPDIDLPDSTVLRVKDGFHLSIVAINLSVGVFTPILVVFLILARSNPISTRFNSPASSLLCTFLC